MQQTTDEYVRVSLLNKIEPVITNASTESSNYLTKTIHNARKMKAHPLPLKKKNEKRK